MAEQITQEITLLPEAPKEGEGFRARAAAYLSVLVLFAAQLATWRTQANALATRVNADAVTAAAKAAQASAAQISAASSASGLATLAAEAAASALAALAAAQSAAGAQPQWLVPAGESVSIGAYQQYCVKFGRLWIDGTIALGAGAQMIIEGGI